MKTCLNCRYFRFVGFQRWCANEHHVKILSDPSRRCMDWVADDDKFMGAQMAKKVALESMPR